MNEKSIKNFKSLINVLVSTLKQNVKKKRQTRKISFSCDEEKLIAEIRFSRALVFECNFGGKKFIVDRDVAYRNFKKETLDDLYRFFSMLGIESHFGSMWGR